MAMFKYTFTIKQGDFSIKSSSWKAACAQIKKQYPDCGFIKMKTYQNLDTRVDSSDLPPGKQGRDYTPDNSVKKANPHFYTKKGKR